jgi:D-3-phosphoglycerate dehydrogenase / 2-oxoglutarate reductase
MSQQRIISTAPIDRTAIDILEQIAPVEIAPSPDEASVTKMLERAIALVCRGEGKVTGRMIAACPTLRVIGRTGAGFDSVDIKAASAKRIPVVYAPIGGFAVAEGALALLLALIKKVVVADSIVKSGQWNKRYEILTGDMMSHTLGIIGMGRIGSHLAKLASAFDMIVLGYDPIVTNAGIPLVPLDELLARSDFVSIHTPLSDDTRGFINAAQIARMKRGAILVNTARGAVVESLDVLADALEGGQLGAVGLDVFPTEPPDCSHRIFKHPNLVCAPHLLGVSELAMDRIYRSMATDMVAVLQGRQPQFCVNPEVFV